MRHIPGLWPDQTPCGGASSWRTVQERAVGISRPLIDTGSSKRVGAKSAIRLAGTTHAGLSAHDSPLTRYHSKRLALRLKALIEALIQEIAPPPPPGAPQGLGGFFHRRCRNAITWVFVQTFPGNARRTGCSHTLRQSILCAWIDFRLPTRTHPHCLRPRGAAHIRDVIPGA